MIRIEQSQQFKRDIKAYQHKRKTLAKLIEVLRMIEREEKLPARLRAHKLHGRYANHLGKIKSFLTRNTFYFFSSLPSI